MRKRHCQETRGRYMLSLPGGYPGGGHPSLPINTLYYAYANAYNHKQDTAISLHP